MSLTHLIVSNVRNIQYVDIEFHQGVNLFFGPNGSGKTSLLEAIYLLSRGRSFKTASSRKIIRHGQQALTVVGHTTNSSGNTIGIEISSQGFRAKVDGEKLHKASQLAELLPLLLITPNANKLILGSPRQRRSFIDWGLFHVKQGYLDSWQKYNRVLTQRNALLKRSASLDVETWTLQLIPHGEYVTNARQWFIQQLEPYFKNYCAALLDDEVDLSLKYRPGWSGIEKFGDALEKSLSRDLQTRFTQNGPHRADIRIIDNKLGDVAPLLSGGQSKLVASALVLAQAELLSKSSANGMVLLVDDLPAELDQYHRSKFLNCLAELNCQLFITTTSIDLIDNQNLLDRSLFHVEQGKIINNKT